MKVKFVVILVVLLATVGYSQIDRSKAPEGGAVPEIKFSEAEVFKLKNGLTVVLTENHKLPVVRFLLKVDVPPLVEGNKEGYLSMMGSLMRNTKKYSKEQIEEESEYRGISLLAGYSAVSMRSMKKYYKKGLELMSQVSLHPEFKQEELDKLRKTMLVGLKSSEKDPRTIFGRVSRAMLYGKNHPYSGYATQQTINNITIEDFKRYHNNYFKPNHSYMIVSGDITMSQTKRVLNKYFGQWKRGEVTKEDFEVPDNIDNTQIFFVNSESAIQAHVGVFNLHHLKLTSKDVLMANLANKILGKGSSGRLFLNLREDKSWTYGAYSSLLPDELIGSFSAVTQTRNEVVDSVVVEMLSELKKITIDNVTEGELDTAKAMSFGNMISSLENIATPANYKFNEMKYNLPSGFYKDYLKNINKVTVKQIRENIGKYIKPDNARVLIVGKGSVIIPKLERLGYKVSYLDRYGNVIEKPKITREVPKGVVASEIISRYIREIGGKKAIEGVETIRKKEEMSMSSISEKMEVLTVKSRPNKVKKEVKYKNKVVSKVVFDGKVGHEVTSQGKKELTDIERRIYSLGMFRQSMYIDIMRYNLKVVHIEYLGSNESYKVEVEAAKDCRWFEYYDLKSGLLLKSEIPIKNGDKTLMRKFVYSDYKEVGDVKLPYQLELVDGSQTMSFRTVKMDINEVVNDKEFK